MYIPILIEFHHHNSAIVSINQRRESSLAATFNTICSIKHVVYPLLLKFVYSKVVTNKILFTVLLRSKSVLSTWEKILERNMLLTPFPP